MYTPLLISINTQTLGMNKINIGMRNKVNNHKIQIARQHRPEYQLCVTIGYLLLRSCVLSKKTVNAMRLILREVWVRLVSLSGFKLINTTCIMSSYSYTSTTNFAPVHSIIKTLLNYFQILIITAQ